MMTDTGTTDVSPDCIPHIKKEIDGFSECSPSNSDMYSPTTTVLSDPNTPNIRQSIDNKVCIGFKTILGFFRIFHEYI